MSLRRTAEVLEDLEIVRERLPGTATWRELADELGMTYAALTRTVQRARARGAVVSAPRPGLRGRAAELACAKRW